MAERDTAPERAAATGRRGPVLAGLAALVCLLGVIVLGNSLVQRWQSVGTEERITVGERYVERDDRGRETPGVWVLRADGRREQVPSIWMFEEAVEGGTLVARTARGGSDEVIAVQTPDGSWEEVRGASAGALFLLLLAGCGLVSALGYLVRRRGGRRPPAAAATSTP